MARKRNQKELTIDQATLQDRLSTADLDTAVVIFPEKGRKIPLNMRIEAEVVDLSRRIAQARHLDGYTQLLRLYIREGLERDRVWLDQGKPNP